MTKFNDHWGLVKSLDINPISDSTKLQQNIPFVRVEKFHYKLINDCQKGLRNQKLNVAKGNLTKSKGDVVTFKVHD